MENHTRECLNQYLAHIAHLNGVDNAAQKFTVSPEVQQTLETHIQDSTAFLSHINIMSVEEQEGEKLGLGVGSPIASTTDTNKQDRQTVDLSDIDNHRYRAEQTNFDTHITYAKLDAWAKFSDFQIRVRDAILKRQALDRLVIGFNGVKRAATSDRVSNPLLQDVNIGWLQHYRNEAPERVLNTGRDGKSISIGKGGDYANLDALVFDAVNNLIDSCHQEDTELVVICGRKLLQDKYFPLINTDHRPTDTLAVNWIMSQKRIGNLPAVCVSHFPAQSVFITRLDNLSLYWQEGRRRRTIIDNAKRNWIENYESTNDAYVIENFGVGCLVDKIVLKENTPDIQDESAPVVED